MRRGWGRERGHGLFGEGTGKNNLPSSPPSPVENLGSVEENKLFISLSLLLGPFLGIKPLYCWSLAPKPGLLAQGTIPSMGQILKY